jgi:hypothetical protein
MVNLTVNIKNPGKIWVQVFSAKSGDEILELNQYGYRTIVQALEETSDLIVIENGLSIGTIIFDKTA